MRAGTLRHIVEIQEPSETIAALGIGVPDLAWSTVATSWASIQPIAGSEYTNAQQQQAAITHRVNVRYPGLRITPRHRIKFGARVFEIVSAANLDERNVEVEIMAKERV